MAGPHLAVLAVASAAVSAYAGIQAAKAQKQMYEAKATLTEKQGRMEALQYKQKGVEVLKNMNKALAATTARSGAGNIDPFSSGDSPDIIMGYTMRAGTNDFTITRDQASITEKYANYQAANYRYAGQMAVRTAKINAVGQIGMGIATAGALYPTSGFSGMFAGGATTTTAGNAAAVTTTTTAPALTYTPTSTVIT